MNSSDRLANSMVWVGGLIAVFSICLSAFVDDRNDVAIAGLGTSGTITGMVGGYLKGKSDGEDTVDSELQRELDRLKEENQILRSQNGL